jgi:SAM-dependent methyltransferase
MELHPLARAFADVAEDYERGRPGYPVAAVAALAGGLGLAPGARIADVGAGTGKLTRILRHAGFDVVAVEPLPGLRARLEAEVPGVAALDGTAEALPLAGGSVDAVACAEAYHWFDGPRAVAEFARVLRPGAGGLALLWNAPREVPEALAPWQGEVAALLNPLAAGHPGRTADQGRGAVEASPAFGPLTCTAIDHVHPTDRARSLAHFASISYVAALAPEARRALLERVDAVLIRHGLERFDAPLRTMVWTARRLATPSTGARA